jgi:hypothetical protein
VQESVALAKTRYPIIVHDQAFRIITCQPPIESGRDRTEVELCNQCLLRLFHFFCVYELLPFKSIRHDVSLKRKQKTQTILMFITLSQSQHVISLLDRQKHFISSTR